MMKLPQNWKLRGADSGPSKFKQILTNVLRRALLVRRELAASEPFLVRARRMGKLQGPNYDNVGGLLEHLEGPEHK